MKDIRDLRKEKEEKEMQKLLLEINQLKDIYNIKKDTLSGYFDTTITFNLDLKNEYLFISLSNEDLKNINCVNCYTNEFEDVSLVDLQDIKSYDLEIMTFTNDVLISIIEDIRNGVEL